ncbi:MAG: hypothetical protein CVT60_03905 [Actinobacteria bacterium HGW-Actinobacteria-10]|jgi:uncharacterized protein YycO|nr:MAG: hypothetical protein CVT60_03905 [Actinobacteria bacterium HGW-Actinobacteria-10]
MNLSKLIAALVAAAVTAAIFAPATLAVPARAKSQRHRASERLEIPKDPAALAASNTDMPHDAGLPGDGSNNLQFDLFRDGDIILGFDAWTVGHAGVLDGTRNISAYTYCVWSAIKSGAACVTLEQGGKYRHYDWAFGLYVPGTTLAQRSAARRFVSYQAGEPYVLASAKTDFTRWYCSKLPWAGYKSQASRDLDSNGGYWVTPADLYNDAETRVFAAAN